MTQSGAIKSFRFLDSPDVLDLPSDAKVAHIFGSASTKLELLDAIAAALNFPGYFGRNWDAFWDCICDLSWLDAHTIAMVHDDIPRALPKFELSTYVHTLAEAVVDWKPGEAHQLVVAFPATCRQEVERILADRPDPKDRPPR